jgi:hypothetical protein
MTKELESHERVLRVVFDPSTDERVTVIGPEQLAELVIMDAGLTSWLVRKVS